MPILNELNFWRINGTAKELDQIKSVPFLKEMNLLRIIETAKWLDQLKEWAIFDRDYLFGA